MGLTSMILGEVALCICWLPKFGWLGVGAAIAGIAIATYTLPRSSTRSADIFFGIFGVLLGLLSACWGAASQLKHLQIQINPAIQPTDGLYILAVLLFIAALGFFIARRKTKIGGTILAALALFGFITVGSGALLTADRQQGQEVVAPK